LEKNLTKYQHAAYAYVGLGTGIVLLTTFFVPSHHYRSDFIPLFIGIIILLAISYFVYRGVSWLTKFLSIAALVRTVWWGYSFYIFGDEETSWVYLMNALLNCAILFMLARAGWDLRFPFGAKTNE